ncbi:MAG: hypothetical protein KDJ17_02860 [Hyphomicrobiaceae bacterium]|nr:hypothetical protein [Hyphomicrobiaceae bacterium]
MRRLFVRLFVLAAVLIPVPQASAAVRVCRAMVSSEIVEAESERAAKSEAISQWRTRAAKYGKGYDSWRLAAQKALKCFAKDEKVACVALGHPCVIQQNPRRIPGDKRDAGQSL